MEPVKSTYAHKQDHIGVRLTIEPMPAGTWALMSGHWPLVVGELRQVVLAGEQVSALEAVPLDGDALLPRRISGHMVRDVYTPLGIAHGVTRGPVTFRHADELYHFLRRGRYQFFAPDFVQEREDGRTRVYRRHDTVDSMTAWEIALHRLESGSLPGSLEVPDGTCPQCLSRFVSMPRDGSAYHCLECHYAFEDQ